MLCRQEQNVSKNISQLNANILKIHLFFNVFGGTVLALEALPEIPKTLKNICFLRFLVGLSWVLKLS